MSTTALHPLAADYLRRLRLAGRHLPEGRLDDLCAEIESHLAETIPPGASEADARSVLERLGTPEEIIEAEQPSDPAGRGGDPRTWREWTAIILLPLGGFAFGVGWLVGLVLLWSSRAWTTRDKVIGTLIVPGGIAAVIPALAIGGTATKRLCRGRATEVSPGFIPGTMHCVNVDPPSALHVALAIALIVVVVIGPLVTAFYLAARARRPREAA